MGEERALGFPRGNSSSFPRTAAPGRPLLLAEVTRHLRLGVLPWLLGRHLRRFKRELGGGRGLGAEEEAQSLGAGGESRGAQQVSSRREKLVVSALGPGLGGEMGCHGSAPRCLAGVSSVQCGLGEARTLQVRPSGVLSVLGAHSGDWEGCLVTQIP